MDDNVYHRPGLRVVSSPTKQRNHPALTLVELLVVVAIIGVVVALLLPARRTGREAARRNQCLSNLKRIANALKNYEKAHGALPPAYTTDTNGKPLHSWRTLILPYMEEQRLYESIDLTKPWDDPANAEAFKSSVLAYQCPSADIEDNFTTYLAVVTPNSCFRATEPRNLSEITDGDRETLMVIEVSAEHAVPWMAPSDADEKAVLGIGAPKTRSPHPNGMQAAFVDDHVEFISDEVPAAQRRALISIAGNDKLAPRGAE
jgi:type II secretory pathway pseudopilin PulG